MMKKHSGKLSEVMATENQFMIMKAFVKVPIYR